LFSTTLASVAAPKETSQASDRAADSATQTKTKDEPPPNVCPEPEQDVKHGASERAKVYQAQVSERACGQLAQSSHGKARRLRRLPRERRDDDRRKGPGLADVLESDSFIVARDAPAKFLILQACVLAKLRQFSQPEPVLASASTKG
jgi:hypothetical protein